MDVDDLIVTPVTKWAEVSKAAILRKEKTIKPLCTQPNPRKLRHILDRIKIRKWIGNAAINIHYIRSTRDWKTWCLVELTAYPQSSAQAFVSVGCHVRYDQLPVTFKGGMKDDANSFHAWMFLRRAGGIT